MQLQTLGGLYLSDSGFTRSKPLLLLSYLAIEGAHSRRVLADLFFVDAKNPRDALSTTYRRLKGVAENLIAADGDNLTTSILCDANTLLADLNSQNYEAAVGMYQGAFLSGLDIDLGEELEEWVFVTREYLASRLREALFSLSEARLAQGNLGGAANLAENAIHLAGASELEPADYLRAYKLLSLTKSPKAAGLKAEAAGFGIKLTENLDPVANSAAEVAPVSPHNLVAASSSFVGRDPELLEIARILLEPHVRLLTVHGPGGIGKSRLTSQVAFEQVSAGNFGDGVFFVALDTVTSGEQITLAILRAFGLASRAGSTLLEQVTTHVADKHILLVLDNFEHLVASATLLGKLLEPCPHLNIIVTSRERLNLTEEYVLPISGLPFPSLETAPEDSTFYDAVQLFIQRARKADLTFTPDEKALAQVVKLLGLLEGVPLGIELAAAWSRVLSLAEISQEIENNLDFLSSSSPNSLERHQSVRATFEYSWNLLSQREQAVLMNLAVFRGGFTREAAASVVGATLTSLVKLVDKSLLKPAANGRFNRHALVFQFSQEKLFARVPVARQMQANHATYFLELAIEAEPHFQEGQQKLWLDRFEQEHENLKLALAWFLKQQTMLEALKLVSILGRFWFIRGYIAEGRRHLEQSLAHPEAQLPTKERAKAAGAAGSLAFTQADYAGARAWYQESLRINRTLGNQHGVALSLGNLGTVAERLSDYQEARSLFEESLEQLRELGDKHKIASALNGLAIVVHALGDFTAASLHFEESLALRREVGDKQGIAASLSNLSSIMQIQGNYDAAKLLLEESLSLRQDLGDKHGVAISLSNLGAAYEAQGEYQKARRLHEESLVLKKELGDRYGIAITLTNLGALAKATLDYQTARACFEESLDIRRSIDDQYGIAVSLNALGELAELEQRSQEALSFFKQSLRLRQTIADKLGIATCLENLAEVYASDRQMLEVAVCLWGAAERLQADIGVPSKTTNREETARAIASASHALGSEVFLDVWNKGKRLALDEAISVALSNSQRFTAPRFSSDTA